MSEPKDQQFLLDNLDIVEFLKLASYLNSNNAWLASTPNKLISSTAKHCKRNQSTSLKMHQCRQRISTDVSKCTWHSGTCTNVRGTQVRVQIYLASENL